MSSHRASSPPSRPHREPITTPASTSLGKWTPTYNLDRPIRTATISAAALIFLLGVATQMAAAKAKAAQVCPEGKELGSLLRVKV